MSQEDALDKTADEIRRLLEQIYEREEEISGLVDVLMVRKHDNPPEALKIFASAMKGSESHNTIQHLLQVKSDWDTLYTRICAYNEDDSEFLEWLVSCVGDLLLEQPEGIDEKWKANLQEFLDDQQAKVN